MKYTVRKSIIEVIGPIWWPIGSICAQTVTMTAHDVESARDDLGKLTRESVEEWLSTHSGDFQCVVDFHGSIEDCEETVDLPWKTEESEYTFSDAMHPAED